MVSGRRVCTVLSCLVLSAGAGAQAHVPTMADYNRAVWTASDGAPVHVTRMAQTPDGWLWLGTPTGLYRFDGVRFHRFVPTNDARLLGPRIQELSAQPDGDLYIGYETSGLSVVRADGRLEHLAGDAGPVKETNHIVRDGDGSLWAGTSFGLRHYKVGSWSAPGPQQGCPDAPVAVALDRSGQLWAATFGELFRVDRAAGRCLPAAPRTPGSELPKKMVGFHASPDGRLWVGADGQLALVSSPPPGATGQADHASQKSGSSAIFDRSGNLWALRCPAGVCLVAAADTVRGSAIDVAARATSRLDQPGQLSSLAPRVIFEDREGDIWLGAPTGIERFRRNTLHPLGLPAIKGDFHVVPDADGSVWLVAPQERRGWRYDPAARRLTALPGKYRGAMAAPDGAIVFLMEDGIRVRRPDGGETRIDPPGPLPPAAWVRSDGERIWLGGFNVPARLWDGRAWQAQAGALPGAEFVFSSAGNRGQMWRGLADGRLVLFEGGRLRRAYDQDDLGGIGQPTCLSAAPELVVCGEAGVAVMHDGRFRRLRVERDELLRRVTGFFVDADGTRWLNGDTGLLRVEEGDWRRAVQSGAPLRHVLFDARDGYTGSAADVASLRMVDGRLWVTTTDGIVELDPRQRQASPVAPQPQLVALTGDDVGYALTQPPRIRAGTTRVRFEFTAPALGRPERIVFGYRLDGVDRDWQTGAERSATYTGLAPGSYRFRVRAMNESGVWSGRERTLDLTVAPTLMQTVHFKLACVAAGLLLLWLGYRLRMRFLTRTLTQRLQVQLEERERIARDLHDTVLQTFQGFVLKVTAMLPDAEPALGETLRRSLRDAKASIEEGRGKVALLRASVPDQLPLHDYLRLAGEQEAASGQAFALRCVGTVRRLHPAVEQELCAIGHEALRNAFRHAQAARHEVVVAYGAGSLVLTIRDDGRGMESGAEDKPGHWGLRGIGERARLIHADACLESAAGAGTTWRIEVKAALAYADGRARGRRYWPRRASG